MIQQTPTRSERTFTAWLLLGLGSGGAGVTGADLLAAHLLGWYGPVQNVTGDLIGLAASLFLFGLGRFAWRARRQ
jgi:hypothetical protein